MRRKSNRNRRSLWVYLTVTQCQWKLKQTNEHTKSKKQRNKKKLLSLWNNHPGSSMGLINVSKRNTCWFLSIFHWRTGREYLPLTIAVILTLLSYYCHYCVKIFDKSHIRQEGGAWVYSLRVLSIMVWRIDGKDAFWRLQENEVAAHIVSAVVKWKMNVTFILLSPFSLWSKSKTPAHGMVLPIFRACPYSLGEHFWKYPHRHSQRCVDLESPRRHLLYPLSGFSMFMTNK